MSQPKCSVIVPSYNRRATLEMVLQGLARQTLPQEQFEVIVVLDGGTDDSAAMLVDWQQAGSIQNLRWHQQPNSGQATARNTGVQLATAPIVGFLDDDVVPEPELLAVHLEQHHTNAPRAVLGDCLIVREQHDSLYHLGVWAWWEDMYHRRALPGRQPGYRDFCAGNVSLRREDFLRVGGFDSSFRGYGGEDYELGYRLLQAGVELVADRNARALHYHRTTVAGVIRATRQEGRGDVLLGQKHPELRAGLRLMSIPRDRYGLLVRTAVQAPAVGDRIVAVLQSMLPLFERTQMRRRWLSYFNHVRGYAYWRGVRDALGSWNALLKYRRNALPIPQQLLDISDGLPPKLPKLWVDGPSTLQITYRGECVGTLHLMRPIESPVRQYLSEQLISQLGAQIEAIVRQRAEPIKATDLINGTQRTASQRRYSPAEALR